MKNSIMVLDTETADLTGYVYDVGYCITDKSGVIVKRYNALVEEIFTDSKKMMGAFYAAKLFTHYAPMLANGEIKIVAWDTIVEQMRNDIQEFGVNIMAAYNLGFDRRVMAQTHKYLGNADPICPSGLRQLDIWQFACETKLSQSAYKKIAKENGWVSPAGNLKSGAEYAYRFCSGDFGFIEDHTALSDAEIEVEILTACYATKKRVPYGIVNGAPWRLIQEKKPVDNDPHIHGGVTA